MSQTSTRYVDFFNFLIYQLRDLHYYFFLSYVVICNCIFPRLIRLIFPYSALFFNTCARLRSVIELSSRHKRSTESTLFRSIALEGCKSLLYTCEIQRADHRGMRSYWWHVKSPWTSLSFGWLYDISSGASRICSILLDPAELKVMSIPSQRM